ncbi:putative PEP-binding protein [Mycoplasmopsis felifaucium]|uniref:PEP-binding protein n=1 Tax=Mycoplasmopsis felifaucium TaxID=35768 RepID=A0ABZ2RUI7_9BACT
MFNKTYTKDNYLINFTVWINNFATLRKSYKEQAKYILVDTNFISKEYDLTSNLSEVQNIYNEICTQAKVDEIYFKTADLDKYNDNSSNLITQIKLILKASKNKKVKVVFPNINSIDKLLKMIDILKKAHDLVIVEDDYKDVEYPKIGVIISNFYGTLMCPKISNYVDAIFLNTDLFYYVYFDWTPAIVDCLKFTTIASQYNKQSQKELFVYGKLLNSSRYLPILIGAGFSNIILPVSKIESYAKITEDFNLSECINFVNNIRQSCETWENVETKIDLFYE